MRSVPWFRICYDDEDATTVNNQTVGRSFEMKATQLGHLCIILWTAVLKETAISWRIAIICFGLISKKLQGVD
jgi:hypothetical protein